jgi:lactate dehydrogenase-like 2-hydroxyacid dehydrogenase
MAIKIGITDRISEVGPIERYYSDLGVEFAFFNTLNELDFPEEKLNEIDALLVWHAKITEYTASRLKKCKLVVRYGVGYDQVDGDSLASHQIPLANNPSYCTEEVADTAVAMILAGTRNVVRHDSLAKSYCLNWQENTLKSWRSNQRTVGLIGLGRIGTATALRLKPFGFKIIFHDPEAKTGLEKALGIHRAGSLQELLTTSDVVSLHCPLTAETEGMINADFLGAMRAHALLVNTARGKILRSLDDLHQHLLKHPDFCVALDVLPQEPPSPHPLIDAWRNQTDWLNGRLTINPHNSYHSDGAAIDMRQDVMITAWNAMNQGIFRNIVNGLN